MNSCKLVVASGCLLVGLSAPAFAGADNKAANDASAQALKKSQAIVRQLTTEKTALQEENAKLTQQLQQFMGKLQSLEPEVMRQKSQLDAMRGSNAELQGKLGRDSHHIASLNQQNQELQKQIRAYAADNQLLKKAVEERQQRIQSCEHKNHELYRYNVELLDRYRDKSMLEEILEKEPFTGIAAVRTENENDQYRYKLDDLLVTQPQPASPASSNIVNETGSKAEESADEKLPQTDQRENPD